MLWRLMVDLVSLQSVDRAEDFQAIFAFDFLIAVMTVLVSLEMPLVGEPRAVGEQSYLRSSSKVNQLTCRCYTEIFSCPPNEFSYVA